MAQESDSLFKCEGCGKCCSEPELKVFLSKEDIERITTNTPYDTDFFLDEEGKNVRKVGGKCVFLKFEVNGKAMCEIYPYRPSACRSWPFTLAFLRILNGVDLDDFPICEAFASSNFVRIFKGYERA